MKESVPIYEIMKPIFDGAGVDTANVRQCLMRHVAVDLPGEPFHLYVHIFIDQDLSSGALEYLMHSAFVLEGLVWCDAGHFMMAVPVHVDTPVRPEDN